MSISYPLSFPTHTNVSSIELRTINAVATSMSPFTFKQQVFAHQGQRWEADVSLPPMKRIDAEQWVAWLTSLKGMRGTFLMGDPVGCSARGSVNGTPVISGAGQIGDTLNISGATASQTGWIKAGDYIQLGSASSASLHKVLTDANSDGGTNVTMDIWPNINIAKPNGQTVVIENAKGVWRLTSNEANWSISNLAIYGITFGCTQAIV